MEIWGHCSGCDRWFPCEGWFDREAPAPCCPMCGAEPHAIENRAVQAVVSITREGRALRRPAAFAGRA